MWEFDIPSFTVHLRAVLPIRKGEQVFVSYGQASQPRVKRQKYLLERYKFNCTCPACASVSLTSDESRMMMAKACEVNKPWDDSALCDWVNDQTKQDDFIVAECHVMIDILEKEKLYVEGLWNVWYQRLVKAYCALEDEENARKWAEKAAKLAKAHILRDAGWDAVAKNPKNTDWWGLRARARSGIQITNNLSNLQLGVNFLESLDQEHNFPSFFIAL